MRLSPSTINLFLECPRCFWLKQKRGIHRPQGPFPSLPGGMDILIKKYFDHYRRRNELPPGLRNKVGSAKLFADLDVLNKWRSWRTGLIFKDKATDAVLSGALDDLMVEKDRYIPTDYKTRGYDVKEGGEKFYQSQLDLYALLLQKNDLPPANFAWLVYWIPKDIILQKEEGNNSLNLVSYAEVKFEIVLKKVAVSTERALKVFRAAVRCLEGPMPPSHSACAFCSWGAEFLTD